jgi:branched-chain amino acid transport system ATP-binding protein
LLQVERLRAGYGDFQALFDVDLVLAEGQTHAIIGANGAGKTTLLRTLAGVVPATAGRVTFDGVDLLAMPAHSRVAAGIAMVPEGRLLFPSLSVRENLLVGGYARRQGHWSLDRVIEVFPLIGPLLDRPSDVLSGGEKQAVAIGRALLANPRVVLLDEVSLGLAPIVVRDLYAAMPRILEAGTSVVVVEQDISQALAVADEVSCLLEGRVVLRGAPGELTREQITAAYFGVGRSSPVNGEPAGAGGGR